MRCKNIKELGRLPLYFSVKMICWEVLNVPFYIYICTLSTEFWSLISEAGFGSKGLKFQLSMSRRRRMSGLAGGCALEHLGSHLVALREMRAKTSRNEAFSMGVMSED